MRPVFTAISKPAVLATLAFIGASFHPAMAQSSPTVTSLVFNPAVVTAGSNATGIVTLDQPAPADTTVWLSTSSTKIAPVPISITVPAGQTSTSFTITTGIVASPITVTISANALDTAQASGTFTVKLTARGLTWFLKDVTFSDGSTAGGYFTYDADSGTYLDVNITTTQTPDTYFRNTMPVFSCPYPAPQSYNTVETKQTSTVLSVTNYFLDPALTGQQLDLLGLVFSQPLTNAGGNVPLVVNPNAQFKPVCTYQITCAPPPTDISQEYYSMPTTEPPGHWYRIITSGRVISGSQPGVKKALPAVWRPSDGTWYVLTDNNAAVVQQWGLEGDVPVPGDYDGDGQIDFAVWRPADGNWYIIPSSNPAAFTTKQWGLSGDVPLVGDFDGDGKTDFAVWRPANGNWYITLSSNPAAPIVKQWGLSGDIPVVGDFDGDGKSDIAVWRPANGNWYITLSSNPVAPVVIQWGLGGDVPLICDFDGDGKADFTVWRPSTGTWYVLPSSNTASPTVQQWGDNGDIPLVGDFDGDGKTDFAVWRPSEGNWYVIPSSNPAVTAIQQWGSPGDVPLSRAPGN